MKKSVYSAKLLILGMFVLFFLFMSAAHAKEITVDSFTISKDKIIVGRTLTYGLFKESDTVKFEYEGNNRQNTWNDYFLNTKLLKSKKGFCAGKPAAGELGRYWKKVIGNLEICNQNPISGTLQQENSVTN